MLKFEKIIEHKDGSATFTFLISNDIKKTIKEMYNKKRFSNKLFKQFVIETLMTEVKKNNE